MKTAAEWLEEIAARHPSVRGLPIAETMLAMLRDAKAELEFFERWRREVLTADKTRSPAGLQLLVEHADSIGWSAIEAKWQSGGYR